MKLINSKFNIDEIIRVNPMAEVWYKQNFPDNNYMFPTIEDLCKEKFIVYDIAKFFRSGNFHLYVQKMSDISIGSADNFILFQLNKDGFCADKSLCWFSFDKPLFIKDK